MNKRYRLGEIEEAVSEMEELIDIEDDIAEIARAPVVCKVEQVRVLYQ